MAIRVEKVVFFHKLLWFVSELSDEDIINLGGPVQAVFCNLQGVLVCVPTVS